MASIRAINSGEIFDEPNRPKYFLMITKRQNQNEMTYELVYHNRFQSIS